MDQNPKQVDRAYRRTANRLGATLLVFLALFVGLDALGRSLCEHFFARADEATYTVACELIDSLAYAFSFFLPVLLLRHLTPRSERTPLPLRATLPRRLCLVIPAGLAIIYSAAVTNAFLTRNLGLVSSRSTGGPYWVDGIPTYEAVLLLVASVLIPAFFEELLFRGAVLTQLLPYGKTVAVLGSALLFGLMHQNADQFLYTTLAGVVLALLTLESGSVWASVLLHLFNNLFAVVEQILYERMPSQTAQELFGMLEVAVIGGGLLCLAALLAKRGGAFWAQAKDAQTPKGALLGFFAPMMVTFVAVCVLQMAWRILIFS